MQELLAKALAGVDPDAPNAAWQIFLNLMRLVPWWPLFWLTLISMIVGAILGGMRGRFWAGVLWAVLLGPFGWLVVLALPALGGPTCPECGGENAPRARLCRHCGVHMESAAKRSARSRLHRDGSADGR